MWRTDYFSAPSIFVITCYIGVVMPLRDMPGSGVPFQNILNIFMFKNENACNSLNYCYYSILMYTCVNRGVPCACWYSILELAWSSFKLSIYAAPVSSIKKFSIVFRCTKKYTPCLFLNRVDCSTVMLCVFRRKFSFFTHWTWSSLMDYREDLRADTVCLVSIWNRRSISCTYMYI